MRNLILLLLTLSVGGAVALGGWWTLFLRDRFSDHEVELLESQQQVELLSVEVETRGKEIERLDGEVERLEVDVLRLETSMRLLKVDQRVAELEVLEQVPDPAAPGEVLTRVRFTEFNSDGEPVGEPLEAEIQGKTVYVDALVLKFEDALVEAGDPLRGSSLCLFRRVFGENQKPSEGVPIDNAGAQPVIYGGDTVPSLDVQELWSEFWDLANDGAAANERGLRAVHGESPFIEVRPGGRYKLELRSSSGLSIQPLP